MLGYGETEADDPLWRQLTEQTVCFLSLAEAHSERCCDTWLEDKITYTPILISTVIE